MTLRHIEGWDYLPAAPTQAALIDLFEAGGYFIANLGLANSAFTVTTGRFNFGHAIKNRCFPGGGGGPLKIVKPVEKITSNIDEAVVGVAVYVDQEHNGHWGVSFYDAINDKPQCTVTLDEYGIIRVWRGYGGGGNGALGTGTLIGWSRAGVYYDEEWWYLEIKVGIDDVTGYCQVRVNTKTVIDLVDINTKNSTTMAGFDSISIQGDGVQGETVNVTWDDFYLEDLLGSVNNDFLGNVRVKTQFTTGAGSLTQWTPNGAATNWQAAQNLAMDDTTYNEENTVGQADFYTIQAIINATLVHGVQVKIGARQTDATQRILHTRINSNSVIAEGYDHYLNQDRYTYLNDIYELNPDTGVGWTGSEVNALQIGPEVQA